MITQQFPTWTKHMCIIYVDTGRKPTIEEIYEQIWEDAMNPNLLWNDEDAFLRHLIRKWEND